MKLHEIAKDYQELLEDIDLADGELDDDLEARLDQLGGDLTDKVEALAVVVRTLEAEGKELREEELRIAKRRKAREARAERLLGYLGACLRVSGQRKVSGKLFTVTIQKNPAALRLLVPEDQVPAEWTRTKVEVDKAGIKAAIAAGTVVEFAVVEQTEGVRIR